MQALLALQELGAGTVTTHISAAPGKSLLGIYGDDSVFITRDAEQSGFCHLATASQASALGDMGHVDGKIDLQIFSHVKEMLVECQENKTPCLLPAGRSSEKIHSQFVACCLS
ncbi:MAG: hypothetical protein ONA90_09110 [candidate division KSB1 bacterium]|nr:hypothetical protein [candidate division KSB1 bacterium]